MKSAQFFQTLLALGAVAGAVAPATAQVSTSLLGTQTGTGIVGSAMDALRQGAVGNTAATGGKVGTFTLSASEGTNQNFAVGTSTNLGINASASSTAEYQVQSNANLGLGGSNFKQVIGTSGTQENVATRAQSLTDYKAQSVTTEVGNSKTEYAQKAIDYSRQTGVTETDVRSKYGNWYVASMGAATKTGTDAVTTLTTSNTVSTLETSFNQATTAVQEKATSDFSKTSSFSDAANGIIRGSFNASEVSSTDTGTKVTNTTVTDTNWAQQSAIAANTTNNTPAVAARDAGTKKETVVTVSAADADSSSTKNNTVVVAGIGNSANVNAAAGSQFTSAVTARSNVSAPTSNSATANGGAGASISSTSNANASNSSFASVFVQSF